MPSFKRTNVRCVYIVLCIMLSVKYGGGFLIVQSSFGEDSSGELIKVTGILKKEILQDNITSSGRRLISGNFLS